MIMAWRVMRGSPTSLAVSHNWTGVIVFDDLRSPGADLSDSMRRLPAAHWDAQVRWYRQELARLSVCPLSGVCWCCCTARPIRLRIDTLNRKLLENSPSAVKATENFHRQLFLSPSSGEGSAHADRLHSSTWLCDMVFRGMPPRCGAGAIVSSSAGWCLRAVHPGRHTLEEMVRWTPVTITAWRFGRVLKAAYWNASHRELGGAGSRGHHSTGERHSLYFFGDGSHADKRGTKNPVAQKGRISKHHPWFLAWYLSC